MIESWFSQDIKKAVKVRYLDGNVFSADNAGNLIGVKLFDDGEPATLSGNVSANVIRADGSTTTAGGTLSGNKASVTLPAAAYAVPGVISVIIKLFDGDTVTTLCAVVANVYLSSTDSVVDPGTVIPSIETLIAAIDAAVASIPADYSALTASVSKTTQNLCKVLDTDLGNVANVPVTNHYNGTMTVNGTSTYAGVCLITDDITLQAGTYRVGFLPSLSDLNIQVRDYTGGSDQGGIAQTSSNTTFSISVPTIVRVRLMTGSGKSYSNVLARPILTFASEWPLLWVPHLTANDLVSRNQLLTGMVCQDESGISDLNTVIEAGYYFLSASTDYNNLPSEIRPHTSGALLLKVYTYKEDNYNQPFLVQELHILSSDFAGVMFNRRNTGGTWQSWVKQPCMECFPQNISDVNDAKQCGFYHLSSSYDYANLPSEIRPHTSGALTLKSYSDAACSYVLQELIMLSGDFAGNIYIRRYAGNPLTWTAWIKINDGFGQEAINRTELESFTPVSVSSQGENKGTNFRVMSYNVARLNNDTETYIPAEKLFNLKKCLGKVNADFIMVQEGNKYIDGPEETGSKLTSSYLFAPIYPAVYGDGSCVIASKQNLSEWGILEYTNGRVLRYGLFEQGSIKLLLVSTHPVWNYSGGGDSPESIAARKTQYKELFEWVNGQISLNRFETTTPVYAPTHTHCVIGMDANCVLAQDKTNLLTEAASGNFIAGNGGFIGWFYTSYSRGMTEKDSIDCIFVSSNIIINNIEAYGDWFGKLYSDHVPVVADLTLL